MIVLSWVKGRDYWEVAAKLCGGADDLKIPDLEGFAESRSRNKAVAYALEELAQKIKELP